jgi:hypothetical protein
MPGYKSVIGLWVALCFCGTVASAQVSSYVSGPKPVSPGGAAAATMAETCPTFSWAPVQWATAYELAVFEVTGSGQLDRAPSLRTTLPGAATTWTPSTSECLRPGAEYMWFMREVDPAGNPAGAWSEGLAFTVVAASPAPASTADHGHEVGDAAANPAGKASAGPTATIASQQNQPVTQTAIAAAAAGAGGPAGPPPTNRQILDTLNQVLAILQAPEPTFSFQLCTEPAFQGELEAGSQLTLDGTIEGRVGAEGYGNGAMVRLKGAPAEKIEGKLKGGWDILKLGICWDIGATVRNRQAANTPPPPVTAAAVSANLAAPGENLVDTIAGLDTTALQDKLQALAAKLQFNPVASIDALEGLGDLSLKSGPFAALREDGIFSQLAQNVPLPPNVRTLLQDPGTVLNGFKEIRDQGLCNLDLPPTLSGPIGEICGLIANERFSKLLDRVDTVTGTINTKVTNVTNKVQSILDQLPIQGDCKLFCGN